VYNTPTQSTAEGKNMCRALQRVFWNLQYANDAVNTKELTFSFGWDSHDAFQQHDIQELNAVLIDRLQEKMKVWHPSFQSCSYFSDPVFSLN
jgi:ubiquitin carboxyl-terminal hydrolase 7